MGPPFLLFIRCLMTFSSGTCVLKAAVFVRSQLLSHVWLCDSMDCSRPDFQERILCCHFLCQGIFLTRGSKLHLLHHLHWQMDSLYCTAGETWALGHSYCPTNALVSNWERDIPIVIFIFQIHLLPFCSSMHPVL